MGREVHGWYKSLPFIDSSNVGKPLHYQERLTKSGARALRAKIGRDASILENPIRFCRSLENKKASGVFRRAYDRQPKLEEGSRCLLTSQIKNRNALKSLLITRRGFGPFESNLALRSHGRIDFRLKLRGQCVVMSIHAGRTVK
jgi:hypothetical protein